MSTPYSHVEEEDQNMRDLEARGLAAAAQDAERAALIAEAWDLIGHDKTANTGNVYLIRRLIEAATGRPAIDWSEHEDAISDAISDSLDADWSSSDGAKAVVAFLNGLSGARDEPQTDPGRAR